MDYGDLKERVKQAALSNGADLVGFTKTSDLSEYKKNIERILPGAQSLAVIISAHGQSALRSANNQVAQFDTIHTYEACAKAAHMAVRFLESQGYPSVAVPAFIPIDMEKPKYGMLGEICWRKAAVMAGLGSYGENGLLITREYGAAVRVSGVVTTLNILPDDPLSEDVCIHCMACVDACPAGALSGNGIIDKKRCGDEIFKFGYRYFRDFVKTVIQKSPEENENLLEGSGLIEMWQTFMTGNYYYCFKCQTQCPSNRKPS